MIWHDTSIPWLFTYSNLRSAISVNTQKSRYRFSSAKFPKKSLAAPFQIHFQRKNPSIVSVGVAAARS